MTANREHGWWRRSGGSMLALLTLLSCGATAGTDGPAPATAREAERTAAPGEARVTRVAIFKNGFGFVFREVAVRGGTTVRVDGAPRAVLGTLWAYPTSGDVRVRGFRAVEGKGEEEKDCDSIADLLRSGVGKRVRLSRTRETGTETVEGTIERVVADDLFLLRTENPVGEGGLLAFGATGWESVVFLDEPAERCVERVDRTQLVIDVGGSGEGTIEYTALEEGLKWVPEYRVERLGGDKVRVTLQGALVNDVTDLRDASIDLVVGVPHYMMTGTLSPLVIEGALQDVVAAAYASPRGRWTNREWASNAMQTQMAMPYDEGPYGGAGDVTAEMGDVGAQDADELSLYRLEHVTLGKGERALVRVFSVEVPVEDIYKWEVAGGEAEALALLGQAASGNPGAIERVARQRVWHHLRLENRGDQPWTTGPAVYFDEDRVVAQDRINYTPAGAAADLRLTMATDVLVQWDDTEDDRQRNARRIDGTQYDLVSGHGELRVRSHKDEEIRLVVVRRMLGRLFDTDGGTVHADPGGAGGWSPYFLWGHGYDDYGYLYYDWGTGRVNSPVWCEWKITLRPDQEKVLSYGFSYYTR